MEKFQSDQVCGMLLIYIYQHSQEAILFTIVNFLMSTFVNMNPTPDQSFFFSIYPRLQNKNLFGRYLTYEKIKTELPSNFKMVGKSVLGNPIPMVEFGKGPLKVLAWSQMHGNESTTTKALFDFFNLLKETREEPVKQILENCTFLAIPMLNPDGARFYTRENAHAVDLNRDADERKEPESRVLREIFSAFGPDFCFNLHDQRTLFSAGDVPVPATLSFLAPACDEMRSISAGREKAMQLIAALNAQLQEVIPGQIGRYDDAFNINCTGDSFQAAEVPTVLFEAGHYPGDYSREITRKFTAFSLYAALRALSSGAYLDFSTAAYTSIPENKKRFCDVLLKNGTIEGRPMEVALNYQEKLYREEILFIPVVQEIGTNLNLFGHQVIDCEGKEIRSSSGGKLEKQDPAQEILLNKFRLSIKVR